METLHIKPKLKIINIDEDEMRMDDNDSLTTIKKWNKFDDVHMLRVKKIIKNNDNNKLKRRGKGERRFYNNWSRGENAWYNLGKGKLNMRWKKYLVLNYISVKRCFKC